MSELPAAEAGVSPMMPLPPPTLPPPFRMPIQRLAPPKEGSIFARHSSGAPTTHRGFPKLGWIVSGQPSITRDTGLELILTPALGPGRACRLAGASCRPSPKRGRR